VTFRLEKSKKVETMDKRLIVSVIFLVVLALATPVQGYSINYTMQNYVSSPNANASAVSVYWPGSCDVDVNLYATATSVLPYTLSSTFFSPQFTLIGSSPFPQTTNINCQDQGSFEASTSYNNFYGATTSTQYDSLTIKTWIRAEYICNANSQDLFIYDGTNLSDPYGNHPFGYGQIFGQCCEQSPSQCTNDLTNDIGAVINYLEGSNYYNACGNDLRQDAEGITSNACNAGGLVSDMDMNYWTMIPFNAESVGIVNISVDAIDFDRVVGGGGTFSADHQYYIWDTVTNTTANIGTAFPLDTQRNLFPNRDYWLLIGTRYYIDNHNWGAQNDFIIHNWTQYKIKVAPPWSKRK